MEDSATRTLLRIHARMWVLLRWTIIIGVHLLLLLLVIGLLTAWSLQLQPHDLAQAACALVPQFLRATAGAAWSALGLSLAGVLWGYARLWRFALDRLAERFLFASD